MSRKYLIIGANGMLGNACMRVISASGDQVWGTVRSPSNLNLFEEDVRRRLVSGVDAEDFATVERVVGESQPDVVVNCVGVVKQLAAADDPLVALPLNSLFPHRLARLCTTAGARLIHISTDCVFSGNRGMYREEDRPDADDLYGVSKRLGEVDYPGAITLRTSIIGHELQGSRSLLDWFLAQSGRVQGFTKAIFSGLSTVELSHVIHDHVAPRTDLRGLYHVSAEPISKYDLLCLIRDVYGRDIEITPSDKLVIDRSLDSTRFRAETGWQPPSWPAMVREMHADAMSMIKGSRP